MNAERKALVVVALAIVVVSFAAILIRLCTVPTAVIAAWRLSIATLILLPLYVRARTVSAGAGDRPGNRSAVPRTDLGLCALSGLFLSLHFLLWIESLQLTTVASSVVLVTTSPIFAAVFGWLFLREGLGRRSAVAIGLCLLGGLAIGRGDLHLGPGNLRGDLYALGGAAAFGAYFVIGRSVRRRMAFVPYVFLAYASAAVMLVAWALATGHHLTGFAPANYLWLFLLALGPQVFGHSSLNWALGYLPAPKVAVSVLGEPVGSALLAWAIFGEVPGAGLFLGGALILCGVYLALTATHRPASATPC